jgi:CheY-like chemotaxis protein
MSAAHILVVDDEAIVLLVATRILREAGFRVTAVEDGAAALELLAGSGAAFDLLVSDIVMPKLDGVALAGCVAALRPELPVILMSGYATEQLRERGIAAPCGVLAKPFTPAELLQEVRRCLGAPAPDRPRVAG